MTEEQFRKKWLRQHAQYEKIAYKEFLGAFRDTADSIPFNMLTPSNYEMVVQSSISKEDIQNAYFLVYREIGIIHGERTGKSINKQIKEFVPSTFLSQFNRTLINWLIANAGTRIVSVRQTYIDYIVNYIANGLTENKTLPEIVTDLKKSINGKNWYRWQLLRIARTETTAAANYGATVATTISGVATDKVWVSAEDARTRRPPKSQFNHLAMNGVRVGQFEKFNVNGEEIDFPGDPKGSAGNIINCRCASAVVVRRDANGKIVRI